MKNLTETVRDVLKRNPRVDNANLVWKCWKVQGKEGGSKPFNPASIIRIGYKLRGGINDVCH